MNSPTVAEVRGRVWGILITGISLGKRIDTVAWLLLLAAAGLAVSLTRTSHLQEASALFGFEPSALIHPIWDRPEFAVDFPNGEAQSLKSLVGQTYRLLGFFPFSDWTIVVLMICAEFCALAIGAFLCTRAIDPKQPTWLGLGTALLVTSSALLNCDIASWGYPYYGSVYNFAYGVGLAGFAAILSQRPMLAGLAIGIAASIHPIIAIFFALASGIAVLIRLKSYNFYSLASGSLVAFVIAGCWSYFMYDGASIAGENIDAHLYITLARMMSWHWFPITLGIFTTRSTQALLPFAGMMLLLVSLVGNGDQQRNIADRQTLTAIVVLILVMSIGVLASEYSGNLLLVKLALHRASAEVLLLSAMIVVPRLLLTITSGTPILSGLATLLLLLSFWRSNGPPILLCMLFALAIIFRDYSNRSRAQLYFPVCAMLAMATIIFWLNGSGMMSTLVSESNLGYVVISYPLFIGALALALLSRVLRQPGLLAAAFLIGSQTWTPKLDQLSDASTLSLARSFLDVQEWARSSTARNALFMTDPGIAYGWREKSERPSFGTAREWLYSGWIYDTRADVMQEGMRRAEALGLDMKTYLEAQRSKPGNVTSAIQNEASREYHSKQAEWFQTMARQFGIEYFVLDKTQGVPPANMRVAYENKRFIVVEPAL